MKMDKLTAKKNEIKKITCNDCKWAGVVIASDYEDTPIQKYCPPNYLWNHPEPEKCPNFVKREG